MNGAIFLAVWALAGMLQPDVGLGRVAALPTGAPDAACSTMTPDHGGAKAQPESTFPFVVSASSDRYASPRDNVTVTLSGGDSGATFKGFLVAARSEAGSALGAWSKSASSHPVALCSAATHNNNGVKHDVTLTWRPPRNVTSGGKVLFTISVVQNLTTFWVNIPVPVGSAAPSTAGAGTLAKPALAGRRIQSPIVAGRQRNTTTPKAGAKLSKSTVAPSGTSKLKTTAGAKS